MKNTQQQSIKRDFDPQVVEFSSLLQSIQKNVYTMSQQLRTEYHRDTSFPDEHGVKSTNIKSWLRSLQVSYRKAPRFEVGGVLNESRTMFSTILSSVSEIASSSFKPGRVISGVKTDTHFFRYNPDTGIGDSLDVSSEEARFQFSCTESHRDMFFCDLIQYLNDTNCQVHLMVPVRNFIQFDASRFIDIYNIINSMLQRHMDSTFSTQP